MPGSHSLDAAGHPHMAQYMECFATSPIFPLAQAHVSERVISPGYTTHLDMAIFKGYMAGKNLIQKGMIGM